MIDKKTETLKQDLKMLNVALECYMGKDLEEDSNLSRPVKQALKDFGEAIDRLDYLEPETKRLDYELIVYKKALDFTCKYSVCFKDECDTARDLISCDECRKKFALEKAIKVLGNESIN